MVVAEMDELYLVSNSTRNSPSNSSDVFYLCFPVCSSVATPSRLLSELVTAKGIARLPDSVSLEDFLAWKDADKLKISPDVATLATIVRVANVVHDVNLDNWLRLLADAIHEIASSDASSMDSVVTSLLNLPPDLQDSCFRLLHSDRTSFQHLFQRYPPPLHTLILRSQIGVFGSLDLFPSEESLVSLMHMPQLGRSLCRLTIQPGLHGSGQGTMLAHALTALTSLESLHLDQPPASPDSSTALLAVAPALSALSQVQYLSLVGTVDNPELMKAFAWALQAMAALQYLCVDYLPSSGSSDATGPFALSTLIAAPPNLTYLHLHCGDRSVTTALEQALTCLAPRSKLSGLDILGVVCSSDNGVKFRQSLSQCLSLEQFHARFHESEPPLWSVVGHLTRLTSLHLSGRTCHISEFSGVVPALGQLRQLVVNHGGGDVWLDETEEDVVVFTRVCRALRECALLEVLIFPIVPRTEAGWEVIQRGMEDVLPQLRALRRTNIYFSIAPRGGDEVIWEERVFNQMLLQLPQLYCVQFNGLDGEWLENEWLAACMNRMQKAAERHRVQFRFG